MKADFSLFLLGQVAKRWNKPILIKPPVFCFFEVLLENVDGCPQSLLFGIVDLELFLEVPSGQTAFLFPIASY